MFEMHCGLKVLEYHAEVKIEGKLGRYSFGTVSGYAKQYGESFSVQRTRILRAQANDHNLVWLNEQATVISSPPTILPEVLGTLVEGEHVYVVSEHDEERGEWIVAHSRWEGWTLKRPE